MSKVKIIGCVTTVNCPCATCCRRRKPSPEKCDSCSDRLKRPCEVLTFEEWQERQMIELMKQQKAGEA